MYTIKQAAARAGISVPVLRQWERRYDVVRPARTASGYRTYDEPTIARVRAMRGLVEEGWAPNAAAARIRGLDDPAVATLLAQPRPAGDRIPAGPPPEDLVEAFTRAAAGLDASGLEAALDEMFARGSFEQVAERLLAPALRRIGDAWAAGEIDVAAEHAASHAVWRRLAIAYQAAARPPHGQRIVLVGLPPGSRHELGALMFSVTARRAGLPVLHLGMDLPVADWIEAADRIHAVAAVIGVVSSPDADPATDVVDALARSHPSTLIAVGGRAAGAVAAGTAVLLLPEGLVPAVDAVRASLGGIGAR